jgi:serine O-acetyltransferase
MNTATRLASRDPLWDAIRQAAATLAHDEPILGSLIHASVLSQSRFDDALTNYILAQRLGDEEVPAMLLRQVFDAVIAGDTDIGIAARADLNARFERDLARASPLEALLFYKGFLAIQAYRLAHALLHQGRRALAPISRGVWRSFSASISILQPGLAVAPAWCWRGPLSSGSMSRARQRDRCAFRP